MNLLRFDGFQSIHARIQAVMHEISPGIDSVPQSLQDAQQIFVLIRGSGGRRLPR